jgi:putative iron-only hydrogenase system regulator
MPCRAGSAVYFQRVPYLRGDFRYGFFIFIGNTVIHSCVKVEPSYEIKNAPRGCAARGKENIALRPAAGGESRKRDSFSVGENMETRIALIGIIVESTESVEQLNHLLHEYGSHIIGRMGIPYREKNVHIISVAIDAPQDVINALSGKIGRLAGITAKTVYSNV